ncbi:peptidoglycan-binding protein [Streptomyces sp. NPDC057116]|uniref:peptidoglycan-binding domain-containing protein n=1 Tax=Streptomyces sp. NPDC057116 TaxID=3346023 RepID=UPI0036288B19
MNLRAEPDLAPGPPPVPPASTMPLYVPLEPELVPLEPAGPPRGARAGARARARAEARSRNRARRPYAVVGAGAAVVVVVGVAAFAGGLFGGDGESDRVLPAPSTPAWPSGDPEGLPSRAPDPASPTASASSSPSAPATASASASGTASPSTTGPATATASLAVAGPDTAPASPGQGSDRPDVGPSPDRTRGPSPEASGDASVTLRRGDRGPEVSELQYRLREAGLYDGPMNGRYNQAVEDGVARYQYARNLEGDGWGVYGPETRQWLEAETTGP